MWLKKLSQSYKTSCLILCVYSVRPYFVSFFIPGSSCETDDSIENNDDYHNKREYSVTETAMNLYCCFLQNT